MANKKFSDFTLRSLATIVASASFNNIYLVGHDENVSTSENIKIPISDFIGFGTIIEETTLSADSTYTITGDPHLNTRNLRNIFVFLAGEEGITSLVIDNINLSTGVITFATPITGKVKIIIFK